MHELKPKAILVTHTSTPIDVIYLAARRCYSAQEEDLVSSVYDVEKPIEVKEDLIRKCVKAGHESVLEHASFTWHITCSRACSHQLVRHRMASYSQQSQRYVAYSDIPFIKPDKMDVTAAYSLMEDVQVAYSDLLKDMDAEDARSILPNMTATFIVVTMNCRELLHFFKERCCYRAQEEIRTIADQMREDVKTILPSVFENSGPKCLEEHRCRQTIPCGKNPWKHV